MPRSCGIRRRADCYVQVVLLEIVCCGERVRQSNQVEALRLSVVIASRVGDVRPADARGPIDRRRILEERVEVDRMIHVARMSGHDIRARVVGEDRRAREVEDVEDIVHGFDDVTVADAHALIGRFDGELVSAARVALLVEVQPFEAGAQLGVRLRLFGGRGHEAASATARKRTIDRPVEGRGAGLVLLRRKFEIGRASGWCEFTGDRRSGAGECDLPSDAGTRDGG